MFTGASAGASSWVSSVSDTSKFGGQPYVSISLFNLSAQAFICQQTIDTTFYLYGHSSAMESKGEQGLLPLQTLITDFEVNFGDGKGMAQVQGTVHIRIREGSDPLGIDYR